jgi:type II secretory pathway component GspD/PulD (secretin)
VTHDDHVLVDVKAKQSDTKGEFNGIPIEDKREAETTLRTRNGQTIFIGGLRRFDDEKTVTKIPILGDIPVVNFMFRNNNVTKECTELMVFLTCNVLPDQVPELTPQMQAQYDKMGYMPAVPDSQRELLNSTLHPNDEGRDPVWRWRRPR